VNSFKSGYKFSPPDPRDKVLAGVPLIEMAKAGVYGTDEHSLPEYTPISDQGALSTCVANAVCDALEILLGLENPNNVVQLSRLMTYWNARSYTQETNKDDGTFIRNAVDSLRTLGVCPESVWPYAPQMVFAQPPLRAYQESLDNKIEAYYTIPGDGKGRCDTIEHAVRANHPVTFAAPVTDEYTKYFRAEGRVWPRTRTWVGYHAQIVVGVRWVNGERQFKVRNSWGPYWGDSGHTFFSEDYMGSPEVNDIWVLTRVPSLVF
jgi:hypothetical protein